MNRRHFITTGLVGLTAALVPTLASAESLYVDDTNDGYLNLRTGPGTGNRIIKRIYGGMELDVIGQSGSWRRVVLADGTTGWASGNFMSPSYFPQMRQNARVQRTNDGYLNLRTGPATNFPILQRLYAGQGLRTIGTQNGWFNVMLADGTRGWASGNFVR